MDENKRKLAREQTIIQNKNNLIQYIWGQAAIEGELLSYHSVENFINNIDTKKKFKEIFEDDDFSQYTIDLLTGLANGWECVNFYLNDKKLKGYPYLKLKKLIMLIHILNQTKLAKG